MGHLLLNSMNLEMHSEQILCPHDDMFIFSSDIGFKHIGHWDEAEDEDSIDYIWILFI